MFSTFTKSNSIIITKSILHSIIHFFTIFQSFQNPNPILDLDTIIEYFIKSFHNPNTILDLDTIIDLDDIIEYFTNSFHNPNTIIDLDTIIEYFTKFNPNPNSIIHFSFHSIKPNSGLTPADQLPAYSRPRG